MSSDYDTLTFKLELTDKHDLCPECGKMADLVLASYYTMIVVFLDVHESSGVEMCLECAKAEFFEASNRLFELTQSNIDDFKNSDSEEEEG